MLTVSGRRPRAATGSLASAVRSPSSGTMTGAPSRLAKRLRPRAAGGLPASASRTVSPSAVNRSRIMARKRASPPKRCGIPVASSVMPSGLSSMMEGLHRSAQRASASSAASSFFGSWISDRRSGTRARASASRSPGASPSPRATRLMAARRMPLAPAVTRTKGASGGGNGSPACRSARISCSTGNSGNHRETMRRMIPFH